MEEYRIRSKEGIERLVNLISLSYSAMTLLPYSDESSITTGCFVSAVLPVKGNGSWISCA